MFQDGTFVTDLVPVFQLCANPSLTLQYLFTPWPNSCGDDGRTFSLNAVLMIDSRSDKAMRSSLIHMHCKPLQLSRSRHSSDSRSSLLPYRRTRWNTHRARIRRWQLRTTRITRLRVHLAVLLVLFPAASSRRSLRLAMNPNLWRCLPTWDLPDCTGKGFQCERAFGPFATWCAGAVEGAEAGVDGAFVGFWATLEGGFGWEVIGGAVLTIHYVSSWSMERRK